MVDNLTRLRKMIGMRGVLGVWQTDWRGCEVPYTFEAVVPPDHIPVETDPNTFSALIGASEFLVRFAACVSEMTTTQIAEIMRKDIQDKPAQWHLGMNTLGFNAVVGACGQYYSPPK